MRIPVVEDEPGIANFVRQGLTEAGHAVDLAWNGREGLEYAMSVDYDVLVLDIMLPKSDGLEVLRELRRRGDKTPTLMLTARGTVDDRVEGLDAGAIERTAHLGVLLQRHGGRFPGRPVPDSR
jgi:DNA-binding response OmpR family regulator